MTRQPFRGRDTHFAEYGEALRLRYPEIAAGWLDQTPSRSDWFAAPPTLGPTPPIQGVRPSQRRVASLPKAIDIAAYPGRLEDPNQRRWELTSLSYNRNPRWADPGYKGLLRMKQPTDLMLYSHLIWELQPRTIIELGSLQGGSALWLANEQEALLDKGQEGKIYSFDYLTGCVHPSATHPNLTFLFADLYNPLTLPATILESAPHPWLVIEDIHIDVFGTFRFFDQYLASGDYYVCEDAFVVKCKTAPDPHFLEQYQTFTDRGYLIDTHYTDAFGYNLTAAPNGWLRKS